LHERYSTSDWSVTWIYDICGSLKAELMNNNNTNLPRAEGASLCIDKDYSSEYAMLSSTF